MKQDGQEIYHINEHIYKYIFFQVERHDAVFVFIELYMPLLTLLNNMKEVSLCHNISSPTVIVSMYLLSAVLGETKPLSILLQSKTLDLQSALAEVSIFHKKIRKT